MRAFPIPMRRTYTVPNGLLNGLTEAWAPDASLAMIGQKTGLNTNTDSNLTFVAQAGFPGGHALQLTSGIVRLNTSASPLVEAIGNTDFCIAQWKFAPVGDPGYLTIGESGNSGFDGGVGNGACPCQLFAEIPGADGNYASYITSDPDSPFLANTAGMVACWYTNADSTMHVSMNGGTVYSLVNTSGVGAPDPTNFVQFLMSSNTVGGPQTGPAYLWQGAGVANAVSQLGSLFADKLQYSDFT